MSRAFWPFVLIAVAITAVTAIGIGARATYGAQTTADEPQYLLSALSLYEDGDLDISDELVQGRATPFHEVELPQQTEVRPDGSRISPHGPLLPLLLAVPMGLWGWVGAKATLAVIAGVVAGGTSWVAHHRFGVRRVPALVISLLVGLAPPVAVYATQVYPEIVAALVVLIAVAAVTATPRRAWLAAAAVVLLPWLAVKFIPVALLLTVWILAVSSPRRRSQIVGALIAAGAVFVVFHLVVYGGWTPYAAGDHFVGGELTAVGTDVDLWGRSTRLVGLLVDRGFGLASWQPLYLLVPVAAAWCWRRRVDLRWPISVVVVTWLTASFVALTMHGWWFPGRQLIVALPLVAMFVGVWAAETRFRLAATAALGAIGIATFVILVVSGLSGEITWVVDFAATGDPVRQVAALLLPDYMTPSVVMWVRHGLWTAVLLSIGVYGWWSGESDKGIGVGISSEPTEDDAMKDKPVMVGAASSRPTSETRNRT